MCLAGMALYRIYRLDPAGHITDAYPVECRSDDVALNAARRVWQWAACVEVWKDSRRVARLTPDRLRTHCRTDGPRTPRPVARGGRRYAA
jgi:hypothetical protein